MLQQIFFGMLLGWGAAIPIGPINLEIVRRNLCFGMKYGLALGLGACSADLTYLILLSTGTLVILNYPLTLAIIGVAGSLILAWFGYGALTMPVRDYNPNNIVNTAPAWRHSAEGYLLTLINPLTILFWSSVSVQVAIFSHQHAHALYYAGLGVLIGTLSWIITLNSLLHITRHRLSSQVMRVLNFSGGIILLAFAVFGLLHVFFYYL